MSSWSIKRVPLDFDWPVGCVWHGYLNPWPGPVECEDCCGTGLNESSLKLYRNFKRWSPNITSEEFYLATQAGVSEKDLARIQRRAWDEVNIQLIQSYLTEIRAKLTKIWGVCLVCQGLRVVLNLNPAIRRLYQDVNLYEEWHPIEPPRGDCWQLWQVMSIGGHPVSPVYKSEVGLAKWCSNHFKSDYAGWLKWITREGCRITQDPPEFKLKCENVVIFTQHVSKA